VESREGGREGVGGQGAGFPLLNRVLKQQQQQQGTTGERCRGEGRWEVGTVSSGRRSRWGREVGGLGSSGGVGTLGPRHKRLRGEVDHESSKGSSRRSEWSKGAGRLGSSGGVWTLGPGAAQPPLDAAAPSHAAGRLNTGAKVAVAVLMSSA
jgi:hypothetical protein